MQGERPDELTGKKKERRKEDSPELASPAILRVGPRGRHTKHATHHEALKSLNEGQAHV